MTFTNPRITVVLFLAAVAMATFALSGCLASTPSNPADDGGHPEDGAEQKGDLSDPSAHDDDESPSSSDGRPDVAVFHFHGTISMDIWPANVDDGWNVHPFEVYANATKIQATLWWNGTLTDLDAAIQAPRYCQDDALTERLQCPVRYKMAKQSGDGYWVEGEEVRRALTLQASSS